MTYYHVNYNFVCHDSFMKAMLKRLYFLLCIPFLVSCSQTLVSLVSIPKLNGVPYESRVIPLEYVNLWIDLVEGEYLSVTSNILLLPISTQNRIPRHSNSLNVGFISKSGRVKIDVDFSSIELKIGNPYRRIKLQKIWAKWVSKNGCTESGPSLPLRDTTFSEASSFTVDTDEWTCFYLIFDVGEHDFFDPVTLEFGEVRVNQVSKKIPLIEFDKYLDEHHTSQ